MTEPRRGRRRLATALVAVIVLALAVAGGWVAAERFQSPAQREAAASPPPASPVTTPVAVGTLADTITLVPIIERAGGERLTLPIPETPAVVTADKAPAGTAVSAGTVVLELSGRPVFLLPGAFPFYRDLGQDDSGPDVTQLQQGLVAAGYSITEREMGTFGWSTRNAVRAMYKASGYQVTLVEAEDQPGPPAADPADPAPPVQPAPVMRLVVPRSEIMAVATLPSVVSATLPIGTEISESTGSLELTNGGVAVRGEVTGAVAFRLTPGMTGVLTSRDGSEIPVAVSSVTARPVTDEQPDALSDVLLAPVDHDVPEEWIGAEILATLTVSVVAEESLIVPTRAVVTGGSGPSHVLRRQDDGSFVTVEVAELGTLGGQSAIAPAAPDALAVGDLVRID